METEWDAVIVGGGTAGLSAGLMLARARRKVLVIDSGQPRNGVAAHMHAVLGHDNTSPLELLARGRRDFEAYGGVVDEDRVLGASASPTGFDLELTGGTIHARRLIVATGLRDELPDIPGMVGQWGSGVVVCPYCDGWEFLDRRIGVIATSPAQHQVQLLRQWSADVTYFSRGIDIDEADARALDARGIRHERAEVQELTCHDGTLTGVALADGRDIPIDIIFTAPRLVPQDALLLSLGAATAEGPMGTFVTVDPFGHASVDGVWAAGNVVNPSANVPASMGAGSMVGAAVNADLVAEDIALAL